MEILSEEIPFFKQHLILGGGPGEEMHGSDRNSSFQVLFLLMLLLDQR